jgi:hypothetical protein
VAELKQRMSAQEWAAWQLYDAMEPVGDRRADLRAGSICATLANVHRDEEKKRTPFTPEDFVLQFEREDPADHQANLAAKMRLLAARQRSRR